MPLPTAPLIESALPDERLDQLVDRVVGQTSSALELVLAANPNLADVGLHLPRGHLVVIPPAAAGPVVAPMIQLWT